MGTHFQIRAITINLMEVEEMKKFLVVLVGLMLVCGGVAWGADAGTLTIDSEETIRPSGTDRAIYVVTFDWLSNGDGDCNTSTTDSKRTRPVTGTVVMLHAIPEGDTSDDYDVTVTDDDGVDVLNGAGTNLPQSATSAENYRFPVDFYSDGPIVLVNRTLTLVVSNGGDSKGGKIRVGILLP